MAFVYSLDKNLVCLFLHTPYLVLFVMNDTSYCDTDSMSKWALQHVAQHLNYATQFITLHEIEMDGKLLLTGMR